MQFLSRRSCTKLQGPFTQAILVAQLNAIFTALKLRQVLIMFETSCNFSATKIAFSCATKLACVNGPLESSETGNVHITTDARFRCSIAAITIIFRKIL